MTRSRLVPAFGLAALMAAGCAPSDRQLRGNSSSGLDLTAMDRGVNPGDDFFAYANGRWFKSQQIPADRSSYGVGAALSELTAKRTAALIGDTAKSNAAPGTEERKIADYYASLLDEATIEAAGAKPLQPRLAAIAAVQDNAGLSRYLGSTLRADVDVLNASRYDTDHLFGLWVAQDLSDPTRYAAFLLQGGLGMPDRDYYLDASPRMEQLRQAYRAHIAAMLKLAGVADADAKATRVLALEKRIAQAHVSRLETEDVQKGNNHWPRSAFAERAPGIDWDGYFAAAGLDQQAEFVVWQPTALAALAALVRSEPLQDWKDWLSFHAIQHDAFYLSKPFLDESFAFYGKALSGTAKLPDRWKQAVAGTDQALGDAVGKLYVAKYFPPQEKARAEAMVKHELEAFAARIDKLSWMAPETKAQAKAKLAALKVGVGYPDKWRDYSGLEVVRGDAFGNRERADLFEYKHNLAKLKQPVDRGEWVMEPQLVNAVNLPAMNALNFPAAILQPPFFDPKRPAVMDYGAAGAVIGHEISHSFDTQGALFDAEGKLRNWWTPADFTHFQASAEQLIKQFDGYAPFPDAHVNGKLTVGENIADVAGLAAAYDAYRLSFDGKEAPEVGGLKGDQQFFVSFAQTWQTKTREKAARQRLLTDPHAPGEFRADTVRNLDAWYGAFAVQPGQHLYLSPEERVRIW